jgi:poly(3-hydroxybutyrate) depolymerase
MFENYCIDMSRVFVTGQSWGGDYTNVQACLFGDIYRAAVPVAANGIYYLTSPSVSCEGDVAVWPMHGQQDEYFPVSFGLDYLDFWLAQNGCDEVSTDLGITTNSGAVEQCSEYINCTNPVRWCLYAPEFGHQIPFDYFSLETMAFFRSF